MTEQRFPIANAEHSVSIDDRKNSSSRKWVVDFDQPHSQPTQDYAIIARLHGNGTTFEQPIFIAAGIGSNGTVAAMEFMTSEASLSSLIRSLPPNWRSLNIEAVIQTNVAAAKHAPLRSSPTKFGNSK
jgi:hypothetical protein